MNSPPNHDDFDKYETLDLEGSTSESVEKLQESLEQYDHGIKPKLAALAVASGGLTGLGITELSPETPVHVAMMGGAVTSYASYTFQTHLFGQAKNATTRNGRIALLATFLVGTPLVLGPSIGTNYPALVGPAARAISEQKVAEGFATNVNQANSVETQLVGIRNLLRSEIEGFKKREADEIKGIGPSGKPGKGHISNEFVAAWKRLDSQISVVSSGIDRYQTLKPKLDTKLGALIEAERKGDLSADRTAKMRAEVISLISEISSIDTKTIAGNVANQIAVNIPLPSGAEDFQKEQIENIRAELENLASSIRQGASDYKVVEVPESEVNSNITVSWSNAWEFWPLTILAIGIDLIGPLLFLLKAPATFSIHAKIRAAKRRRKLLAKKLKRLRGPDTAEMTESMLDTSMRVLKKLAGYHDEIINIANQGHPNLPLDENFYDDLECDDENDVFNADFEDFWETEKADEGVSNGKNPSAVNGAENDREVQ